MGIVQVLDIKVANLIAAGEVVERPASVVKELLENAIDAGATQITIEIKNGGISFIKITDNGKGMAAEDVPVALKRHATSKIRTESDLDGIMTLGFRGEALAAIASVSDLRIITRRQEDKEGTLLYSSCGEIKEVIHAGCAAGTTIIVEQLFSNVPARRKFLKKDSTEAMAVGAVVEKIALSHPEIAITFVNDSVTKYATAGDGNLYNTIYVLFGRDFVKKITEVKSLSTGIEVVGYIGRPDNVRSNRNFQNFFINGRYIKSKTASAALEQAFDSFIPSDKFPCCILNIVIHPSFVDVNVHPTKLEIKFSDERAVFHAIYYAVRNAIVQDSKRPDLSLDKFVEKEYVKEKAISNSFVPVEDRESRKLPNKVKENQLGILDRFSEKENPASDLSQVHTDPVGAQQNVSPNSVRTLKSIFTDRDDGESNRGAFSDDIRSSSATIGRVSSDRGRGSGMEISSRLATLLSQEEKEDEVQSQTPKEELQKAEPPLGEQEKVRDTEEKLPYYRILGVAFQSYIFVELEDKIWVIDKHAAHERILFEELKKNLEQKEPISQVLLLPIKIELSALEYAAVDEYSAEMEKTGFGFELDSAGSAAAIFHIPGSIEHSMATDLFITIASQLSEGTGDAKIAEKIVFEKALYQASCKAAVKFGRKDRPEDMEWICQKLLSMPDVRYCPHGRPVAMEMSKRQFEHQFKRS